MACPAGLQSAGRGTRDAGVWAGTQHAPRVPPHTHSILPACTRALRGRWAARTSPPRETLAGDPRQELRALRPEAETPSSTAPHHPFAAWAPLEGWS